MSSLEQTPSFFLDGVTRAADAIHAMRRIVLAAHVNLDGDALGSLAAMGYILKALEKEFCIYSCTGIPDYLKFLQLPCHAYADLDYLPFTPEGAIYLDCSEPGRLGRALAARYTQWPSINIDHHLRDGGMGSLANCIYPQAAATVQLVAYIAMALNQRLEAALAESVAVGLITDTGGFCHGNTSADVLRLCALLLQNGCDLSYIREKLYNNWTEGRLKLWGQLFSSTQFIDYGKIAICPVSLAELASHHCSSENLEGLVEMFRRVKSVQVAALVREEDERSSKFSLRSSGSIDVCAMAARLGGGGHQNAAGGLIHLPLWEAVETLRRVLEESLRQQGY